jgi:hypothetical protein
MKFLVFLLISCWVATLLIATGCNKEYREKKQVTHIKIEKIVDYDFPPVNISASDQKEMEEFQEAELEELPPVNMNIYYLKCTL